jgi:NADH dehydrogenase
VAENVIREMRGQEPEPFIYHHFGDMISLGTNAAVANVFGYKLTGFPAWMLWRLYYLGRLQGIENKLRVVVDWVIEAMFERYTARLDLGTTTAATSHPRVMGEPSIGGQRSPGTGPAARAGEPRETPAAGTAGTSTSAA